MKPSHGRIALTGGNVPSVPEFWSGLLRVSVRAVREFGALVHFGFGLDVAGFLRRVLAREPAGRLVALLLHSLQLFLPFLKGITRSSGHFNCPLPSAVANPRKSAITLN